MSGISTTRLHKLLLIMVALILALFIAVPSPGQKPVKPDISGDQNKTNNLVYPQMRDSIMEAELTGTDGTKFRLKDLRGKVILLNLWAIWSGPCRAQIPTLIELQEKYGQERLVVIGLSAGDSDGSLERLKAIKKFSKSFHLNYQLVRSSISTVKAFNKVASMSVVPKTLLIGIDGTLRGVFMGSGPPLDAALSERVKTVVIESEEIKARRLPGTAP